jgi:hypothetical protein
MRRSYLPPAFLPLVGRCWQGSASAFVPRRMRRADSSSSTALLITISEIPRRAHVAPCITILGFARLRERRLAVANRWPEAT